MDHAPPQAKDNEGHRASLVTTNLIPRPALSSSLLRADSGTCQAATHDNREDKIVLSSHHHAQPAALQGSDCTRSTGGGAARKASLGPTRRSFTAECGASTRAGVAIDFERSFTSESLLSNEEGVKFKVYRQTGFRYEDGNESSNKQSGTPCFLFLVVADVMSPSLSPSHRRLSFLSRRAGA